jgi:hypothetical protein
MADRGQVDFTREGNALIFSLGNVPADSIPADSLADKAVYDLWHWQDTRLSPAEGGGAATATAPTRPSTPGAQQVDALANDSLPQVQVSDDGKRVLAVNSGPYAIEQFWGEGGNDVYLIDAATGARTLVAKKLEGRAQLSPDARFVYWFDKDSGTPTRSARGSSA